VSRIKAVLALICKEDKSECRVNAFRMSVGGVELGTCSDGIVVQNERQDPWTSGVRAHQKTPAKWESRYNHLRVISM
jgi:hypothetical protein